MKDIKTFPQKTCLKHIIYTNIDMGLYAHITSLPTTHTAFFLKLPLDFKIEGSLF